jgi:hypothetical protein
VIGHIDLHSNSGRREGGGLPVGQQRADGGLPQASAPIEAAVWKLHRFWGTSATNRVVLSDVLGGKDVVEGRDGRTDGRVG